MTITSPSPSTESTSLTADPFTEPAEDKHTMH